MERDDATWVSLKEASERAGVSISWLRKQYRRNRLPTREVAGPRGLQKEVPLEEVVAQARAFTAPAGPVAEDRGAAPAPPLPAVTDTVPVAFDDLARLFERAARAEQDRALLERLVDVERRAVVAEAENAYLRLRLEDAFAEVERLRRQLERDVE